jgi:hypothetical protein
MARRRQRKSKRKSPQKYKTAFNIKRAGFSYLNLAVFTNTLFDVTPLQFFLSGYVGGAYASGGGGSSQKITLKELLSGSTIGGSGLASQDLMLNIKENIRANAVMGIGSLIGLRVADKAITKLGMARSFNSTVRATGMGSLVKM